jgi:hypothetical protein
MHMLGKARHAEYLEHMNTFGGLATKLLRTFTAETEAQRSSGAVTGSRSIPSLCRGQGKWKNRQTIRCSQTNRSNTAEYG